jgi:hypothetical protein
MRWLVQSIKEIFLSFSSLGGACKQLLQLSGSLGLHGSFARPGAKDKSSNKSAIVAK